MIKNYIKLLKKIRLLPSTRPGYALTSFAGLHRGKRGYAFHLFAPLYVPTVPSKRMRVDGGKRFFLNFVNTKSRSPRHIRRGLRPCSVHSERRWVQANEIKIPRSPRWSERSERVEGCERWIRLFFITLLSIISTASPVSVGSNSAFSRQPLVTFPTADTNNTMLGFASFAQGFRLTDQNTSCTFDCFFPVSGEISINGGWLYLSQDLVLSNSFDIRGGGRIRGNNRSFGLGKQLSEIYIPHPGTSLSVKTAAQATMDTAVQSTDWIASDNYIASCSLASAAGTELRIYYFDGSTLTLTQQIEMTRDSFCVRWNPKSAYVAVGRSGGSNEELRIYYFNISNGTFNLTDTRNFGNKALMAVAWHPSGDYLAIGTGQGQQELATYSFSRTTGLLKDITPGGVADLTPDRGVSQNALSWDPGGTRLVVGATNNVTAGATELVVCSFSPTNLTITTSAEVGVTVNAADWCPAGTYIAAGLATGGAYNIRIYQHRLSPESLVEVLSARVAESNAVLSAHWDSTGSYVWFGISAGASSAARLYYFDKTNLTLNLVNTVPSTVAVDDVRWSHNNSYFVRGDAGNNVIVAGQSIIPFVFRDLTTVLNGDATISSPVYFQGNCRVDGRGSILSLGNDASFIVRPNSRLVFEDVILKDVGGYAIRCMSDSGALTLRNTHMFLDDTFSFSRGSILFEQEVHITGTKKFAYESGVASTIATGASLYIDQGLTLSYAPRNAKRDLLYMQDERASLFLNGCTLSSTRTGLQLSQGALFLDNAVTLSSAARYKAEALTLKSSLSVNVLGGACVDVQGLVAYD